MCSPESTPMSQECRVCRRSGNICVWKLGGKLYEAGEMNFVKDKLGTLMRRVDEKFTEQFEFGLRDVTFMNIVNYLHKPRDSASLAITRILFGLCMLFDIPGERGGATMTRRWGDSKICHFPLHPYISVMPMPHMAFVYLGLWLGALGIMLGYKYKRACVTFTVCYWYLFLIEKSFWNNHTYLFGLVAFLLCFTRANCYWSLDVYLNPYLKSETVPYWNYFLLKYQFFILYFMAGMKKGTAEWLTGYSMPKLSEHWVFAPFRLFLTVPQIDYIIVHWFVFVFDLTIAMWMMWGRTRHVAMFFCALFHLMNSRMFTIGMFPWVCLATMPLFYPFDWPRRVSPSIKYLHDKLKSDICNLLLYFKSEGCCNLCENNEATDANDDRNEQPDDNADESINEENNYEAMNNTPNHVGHDADSLEDYEENNASYDEINDTIDSKERSDKEHTAETVGSNIADKEDTEHANVTRQKKVTTAAIMLYVFIQLFLPYSHFITQGYNNWTNGLYGYSWDMMVHTWQTHAVVVKIVDNEKNQHFFIDPLAYTPNDRWTRYGDMVYQYARCLNENILKEAKTKTSGNVSIYVDIWASMNGRFIQRMFDNKVDLLKANWSPFKRIPFLMPIIEEGEDWRSKLEEIKAEVQSWNSISDVIFLAEFPGYEEEKYIAEELRNVSVTSLKGTIAVEPEKTAEDNGQTLVLFTGDHAEIDTGLFHKVRNIDKTPAYYMYMFSNVSLSEIPRARPKLPIVKELKYQFSNWLIFFDSLVDNIFPRCFWTSKRCYS